MQSENLADVVHAPSSSTSFAYFRGENSRTIKNGFLHGVLYATRIRVVDGIVKTLLYSERSVSFEEIVNSVVNAAFVHGSSLGASVVVTKFVLLLCAKLQKNGIFDTLLRLVGQQPAPGSARRWTTATPTTSVTFLAAAKDGLFPGQPQDAIVKPRSFSGYSERAGSSSERGWHWAVSGFCSGFLVWGSDSRFHDLMNMYIVSRVIVAAAKWFADRKLRWRENSNVRALVRRLFSASSWAAVMYMYRMRFPLTASLRESMAYLYKDSRVRIRSDTWRENLGTGADFVPYVAVAVWLLKLFPLSPTGLFSRDEASKMREDPGGTSGVPPTSQQPGRMDSASFNFMPTTTRKEASRARAEGEALLSDRLEDDLHMESMSSSSSTQSLRQLESASGRSYLDDGFHHQLPGPRDDSLCEKSSSAYLDSTFSSHSNGDNDLVPTDSNMSMAGSMDSDRLAQRIEQMERGQQASRRGNRGSSTSPYDQLGSSTRRRSRELHAVSSFMMENM
ncbi:unnamed protein product [Amoebophrya sp. A25]|nr:unnamed protein product [Amoebophrya sp. A25]|eukprot:GSA25T00003598001.1